MGSTTTKDVRERKERIEEEKRELSEKKGKKERKAKDKSIGETVDYNERV